MTAEEEHGHDQLWADYLAGLSAARDIWMNSPWVRDRQDRSRALMQVTSSAHVAFNIAISPRHNFPFFDRHPFHHPIAYSWGLCCPDFHYRHAFVDGARSYRITGRRGSSPWNEFYLMSEFWGDPDFVPQSKVTKVALADLHDHLYPDHRKVSPEERASTIEARRNGVKRLYGL